MIIKPRLHLAEVTFNHENLIVAVKLLSGVSTSVEEL